MPPVLFQAAKFTPPGIDLFFVRRIICALAGSNPGVIFFAVFPVFRTPFFKAFLSQFPSMRIHFLAVQCKIFFITSADLFPMLIIVFQAFSNTALAVFGVMRSALRNDYITM